jgi:hypothetical protein
MPIGCGRRGCAAIALAAVAVTGCRSAQHASTPVPQPRSSSAASSGTALSSSGAALPTCGDIPQSDGPLASKVHVQIVARTTAVSGSMFSAAVQIRSNTAATVPVESVSIVELLVTQDGHVVGRQLGPSAGTGAGFDVTPSSLAQMTTEVALSGCGNYSPGESLPDATMPNADTTRKPLPAGEYTIYAVVEDDTYGELNPRKLVSAPFALQVTPTTPSPSATATTPATLDRTFTGDGGSFSYPSAWTLSQFPDDVSSFAMLLAVISNQAVHDPCVTSANSITCDQPLNWLDSGGVLIKWGTQGGLGTLFASPSGSPSTIDGKPATVTTNPTTDPQCGDIPNTAYELDAYIPQSLGNGWTMTACLATPIAPQTLATVTAMLHSLRFDSDTTGSATSSSPS